MTPAGMAKDAAIRRSLPKARAHACGRRAMLAFAASEVRRVARRWDVLALHADLQAWAGNNTAQLARDAVPLVWMAVECWRIQRGAPSCTGFAMPLGNALAQVAGRPQQMRTLRPALVRGMAQLQQLRPLLDPSALVEAERRLRRTLRVRGCLRSHDINVLHKAA